MEKEAESCSCKKGSEGEVETGSSLTLLKPLLQAFIFAGCQGFRDRVFIISVSLALITVTDTYSVKRLNKRIFMSLFHLH